MSSTLREYKFIEDIHEGVKTLIYRGRRDRDGRLAIVKTLKAEYPSLEDITQLRHEYKILQLLNGEGIVKSYGLEKNKNGVALILEDFGAHSLALDLQENPKKTLSEFLNIAIQLAEILAQLHQNEIIHKDIKPHNILINPSTGQVKLTDFSIATRLSRETQNLNNPTLLEGTLAYMSPEQTGRMNRSLDYRTDFYSLGVALYEILAHRLPFESRDPMELVHCHIAKTPVPPHEFNPKVPKAVSAIVMKLLVKRAEERYQSALGLKADLEACQFQLETLGTINNFVPGMRDKSGHFLISQKLYGRAREVTQLLNAFNRVSNGTSEMILVSGYSGIGKTSVVNEVHKPILRQRGYFIAGKFDQFKRNIPYAATIQAFSHLVRQVLTESAESLAIWKEKLLEALGNNARAIVDVIPELELIIGPQPPIPELGAIESQNRFNRVFQKFVSVVSQPEHPLVLFLDDLQWADAASLQLIERLMTDPDSKYLLLVGAYRDNEVSPVHPTIQTRQRIEESGVVVNDIVLGPLGFDCVSELVLDTLKGIKQGGQIDPFVDLLYNKTGGNPFFLTQLLETLHKEKLLTFDFEEGVWQWDIQQIHAIGITDYNVVQLVARNIQTLSPETVQVLKLAACIGNQFNLDILAIVSQESVLTTAERLWEALQAGLILPLSNAYKIPLVFDSEERGELLVENSRVAYKFLHDRVQQAAYSLIPPQKKQATHLKIGQLLLQKTSDSTLEENIFDLVNQLNIGVDLITDAEEKERLAQLNLKAGRKAKAAAAYEPALRYLNVALELLDSDCWESQYELAIAVYVAAAEAEFLNTHFDRANLLSDLVLEHARTLLDRVKVYEAQIQFYMSQNEMQAAVNTALYALKLLGIHLPNKPSKLRIITGLIQTKLKIGSKTIEELADLPPMSDPYKIAAMRLLLKVGPPAYIASPEIYPLVILNMVNLCIKYGNSPLSPFAYAQYGIILSGVLSEVNSGYQFCQLALRLLDKFDVRETRAQVYLSFNVFVRHWRDRARDLIEPLLQAVQSGLETGELEYAGAAAGFYCNYIVFVGEELDSVVEKQGHYIELTQKLKQEFWVYYAQIWREVALNLQGRSPTPCRLMSDAFNEEEVLPRLREANSHLTLLSIYGAKVFLGYFFQDYQQCIVNATIAEKYDNMLVGLMHLAENKFYYSLALLALYPTASKRTKKQYLKKVASNQKKMKQWATNSPANYQHKYELVEAEKARVLGQDEQASNYYERAVKRAGESGYLHEEALANELASVFHLSLGREKIAKTYITDAYYGYIRWGAEAKARDLHERYPQFITNDSTPEITDIETTRTANSPSGSDSRLLDLTTVVKASQALSREIVLSNLLENLMKITLENAGAQKGYLLAKEEERWAIAAEGTVEKDKLTVLQSTSVDATRKLPLSIVNYVARTEKSLVLDDATVAKMFSTDPYILAKRPKSVLCLPIAHQGKQTAILYLENNLTPRAFTTDRVALLQLLTSQISISIENARLYQREQEKSQELQRSLHQLQTTQAQLVHTEKISTLGQLVAGVAHEVNNPVGFISGNIHHICEYTEEIFNHLKLYQQHFPTPPTPIVENAEEIDLEFVREDLPQLLSSIKVGTDRIRDIMQSLRNFSRVDKGEKKPADLESGLESTLMILSSRLKGKGERKAIQVVKEYADLPEVMCFPGQLNQVFMNLVANAIDALETNGTWHTGHDSSQKKSLTTHHLCSIPNAQTPTIRIRTEWVNENTVEIRIKDNGPGMTEEVRQKLFEPFFTTKPEGKGTGLGLSISYQIVTEKHGGNLYCVSAPGTGTEFIIKLPIS